MSFWNFCCGVSQGEKTESYCSYCLIIQYFAVLFLSFASLLSCSPELQALLMNQLTVKVRIISHITIQVAHGSLCTSVL